MKMYTNTEKTDDSTRETRRTTRRFEGFDARFGTDPDEIYIELRLGSPKYVHLREGDFLQEGDAFHREQLGLDSPTLDTWEVTEITPEHVVGRHIDTGEETTWDRTHVEKGLAVGRYSTNLTDFEWISVYQAGSWDDYDPDTDTGSLYAGRPYVSVVAYGDNGLRYGRRYRFVSPDSNELVRWKEDRPLRGFEESVAARFDRRIREALEAEGYTVRDPDPEPPTADETGEQ